MKERTESARCVYGPVPSRRLGLSLGVDLVPFKTCTYDCVYCQLGRTTKKCVERKEYVPSEVVLHHIEEVLSLQQKIDYITFSGSGEPTLHSSIGTLITGVKKLTTIPVAVITNSSLLPDVAVQDALLNADLVMPSLDAGTEEAFQSVNQPHDTIQFNEMVEGLARFSEVFRGELWLEIMLVRGINDSDEAVDALCSKLQRMRISKIQLNTVFRPPAEEAAQPVDEARLQRIRKKLGTTASIVTDFKGKMQDSQERNGERRIYELIRRRPATAADIAASLGMHRNEVLKYLVLLEKEGHIKRVAHEERTYYEPV